MRISRALKVIRSLFRYQIDEFIPEAHYPRILVLLRWLLAPARKQSSTNRAKRLRLFLQDMGPVFVKFGQMLSTRRDLLDHELASELEKLQDKVPAFSGEEALILVKNALGKHLFDQHFKDFDTTPLASASIAQVHKATLIENGVDQDVVVKVIRPDIEPIIRKDLKILKTIAQLVTQHHKEGHRLRLDEVVAEYEITLMNELDLMLEGANTIQLRRNFLDSESLYVPEVYSDYVRKNVLVMERIHGIPVGDVERLKAEGVDMALLASRGVEVFFTQVFRDSFFHADMHPGNIFVAHGKPNNPQYIGIDCGIVGTLNKEDKRYLAENFLAFFNRDYRKVAELHVDSGWVPDHVDVAQFENAIRSVCEPIFQKPIAEISFGLVLMNLFNTARRFEMRVQPQLVLLQKTLLYIEGLGRQLYPQLDLWQTAKPFLEDWMKEQIGPKAVGRKIIDELPYWSEKLPEIPNLVFDSLNQLRQLPQRHQEMFDSFMSRQQRLSRSGFWLTVGATLAICTAIVVDHLNTWQISSGFLAGVFALVRAWWLRKD